jgi:hypothetical protein
LRKPSGEEPTTCQPCWNKRARISGARTISLTTADNLLATAAGIEAGAATAF